MRWYNQQESGPWDAVGQIASAIMQRNQQRGQEKKDLQSLQTIIGLQQPSEVDTGTGMRSQINFDPSLQTVKGATPQRGLFDFAKIGQTPPIYSGPQEQQPAGLMQPQQITGQNALTMPQQPAPQIQAPTITQRERTIKDVEGDIRKSYATRLQDAVKSGVNPTMLQQYMPTILKQRDADLAQARTDYKTAQGDAALQDVLSANGSAAQKKAFVKYAQVTGNLDPATLRGLLSSNTQKYDDGANIHFYRTDSMGNPVDVGEDGNPKPYFSIPKQVSPELLQTQSFQASERQKDRDAAAATAAMRVSSGGGGGNGLSTANLFSLYKDATETVQEATGEFDAMGRPIMTRRIKNPELAQRLKPIIDSMLPGGEGQAQDNYQPQPAQQDLSGKVSAARARGISDSQIRSALLSDGLSQQEINALMGVQQPQRQQPELNPVGLDASMWY